MGIIDEVKQKIKECKAQFDNVCVWRTWENPKPAVLDLHQS